MANINITKGNDITLRAVLTRDGEMFPVEVSSDVSCYLVSCVGSRTLLTHDIIEEGTFSYDVEVNSSGVITSSFTLDDPA